MTAQEVVVKADDFDAALAMLLREHSDEDNGEWTRGLPASVDQVAALESYWGRQLPPLYRRVLARGNGAAKL